MDLEKNLKCRITEPLYIIMDLRSLHMKPKGSAVTGHSSHSWC